MVSEKKYLFILLSILILLGSCKSKKKFVQVNAHQKLTNKALLHDLINQPAIDFFTGKAKVKISDAHTSEKGTLYIRSKKDSVIWFAVKKLSVEGGRAQLSQDSLFAINRLEKSYISMPFDSIQKQYGLMPSLSIIQNLVAGILPPIDTTLYLNEKNDSQYYKVRTMSEGLLVDLSVDQNLGKLSEVKYQDKYNSTFTCILDDYRIINDSVALPYYRKYSWTKNEENLSIEMKFSNLAINEPKQIKFSIPNHYKETK